eukprot:3648341-Pleurochrysis_carterae.AAC.1
MLAALPTHRACHAAMRVSMRTAACSWRRLRQCGRCRRRSSDSDRCSSAPPSRSRCPPLSPPRPSRPSRRSAAADACDGGGARSHTTTRACSVLTRALNRGCRGGLWEGGGSEGGVRCRARDDEPPDVAASPCTRNLLQSVRAGSV